MAAPHRSSCGFLSSDVQVRASDVPNDPLHRVHARLLVLCLVSHQQRVTAAWDGTSARSGSPAHLLIYAEVWMGVLYPIPFRSLKSLSSSLLP